MSRQSGITPRAGDRQQPRIAAVHRLELAARGRRRRPQSPASLCVVAGPGPIPCRRADVRRSAGRSAAGCSCERRRANSSPVLDLRYAINLRGHSFRAQHAGRLMRERDGGWIRHTTPSRDATTPITVATKPVWSIAFQPGARPGVGGFQHPSE